MSLIEIARLFLHVREAGQNKGLRVEAIQHWSAGSPGDSWCMEMLWMWLDLAYKGKSPIDRMQSVEVFHQTAHDKGWILTDSDIVQPGDIAISIDPVTHKGHHIALVTSIEPLQAIAGNTSEDGTSSNGTGVFEHTITTTNKVFARLPE